MLEALQGQGKNFKSPGEKNWGAEPLEQQVQEARPQEKTLVLKPCGLKVQLETGVEGISFEVSPEVT
jgi:hypothetical protein